MELRDWCVRILSADTLEEKLFSPEILSDDFPGSTLLFDTPSRPAGMQFQKKDKKDKLPPFHEHHLAENRAICLHRFAGHELLAVEVMAYAILAFPSAPKRLRKGIANTLKEEQTHVRLYQNRLLQLGVQFGDLPLYKHFWALTPYLKCPLQYLSVMSLTLEMANLDFAPLYEHSFKRHDDLESALLMETILRDEIAHVSFGIHWLKKLKDPAMSEWETWKSNLPEQVSPKRAKGFVLFEQYRKQANIPLDWIENLKKY